jgi:5-methylcytosine-specific restriction endonuclease McrA
MIELENRDEAYAAKSRSAAPQYRNHIDGFNPYWQNLRARRFEVAGYQCEICGEKAILHCHHLHYNTLGFEEIGDVQALCSRCHNQHHQLAA